MTGPSLRRTLALGALLTAAATASARADECARLVDVLPARTFADGTHTVTLSPPAASLGQWFVTASGDDPAWVEVDGKTVVTPSDLCGPRRDRVTVAVKLRASSRVKVRVPGRHDRLTVRVFGVAPASALPANVGKPVGDVLVFEELLPGGIPARIATRTVTAPGADGVLFLSAEQAGSSPVLLSKLLWNDEAALGATVLRPNCQPIVEPVVAHSTNTLATWVLGFPGSRMRVRLRGWVVDTVAPTAAWSSPTEGAASGPGTTLRLTWADAGTGVDPSQTKITLNGHDVTSAFALGATEATAPFAALPASALVAGTNVLRATVKDRACNAVSVERRFTTGTTPPPDTTPPVLAGTPSNLTVEQTGPLGAVVTYTAPTVTDDRDPAPVVTCVPASGSTFTAGTTTVTCTATDAAGNASTSTFTVTVRDTTAPTLSQVPADLTVEQTGPLGAVVTFAAPTVADAADPTAQVVCSPASGSLFPAGTTTVTCTATDAAGNASTATFTVTVRDTTAPVLSQVPADLTVEQTGPTGAVVTFAAPAAVDAADPAPVVSCVPASGSVFPAGTTTVTCSTRDAAGNLASATFQVTVRDRTAPTFTTGVQDFTVEQTGPTGAIVVYPVPTAVDAADPAPVVTCVPNPGTLFPAGDSLVECSATDAGGNTRLAQFVIHVVDGTAPTIAIAEPALGATVGPGAQLRVTFSDAVEVAPPSLAVRVNGRDVTELLTRSPGTAQASLSALGLESGSVQVDVQVSDLAGNVGTASTSFVLVVPVAATRLAVEIPPAPGSSLKAGQAYDLTLRALTASGDVAVAFTGVVILTSTDPTSVLNGLVVDFDATHVGVRTLRGVAQFSAIGPQTVTAMVVLGPPVEGRLDFSVERSERGRVIAVVPSGAYFPGQTLSARIFVDMGTPDDDPATFQDVLGAYDIRLLYDTRQVEIVRVDPGSSSLGAPLFRLPGSVRLMDLNDLGSLAAHLGPDASAVGLVLVASIDLVVRDDAPGGPLALAISGDALTTAVPAADDTFALSPVGGAGPRPGELEGQVQVVSSLPSAGLAMIGVIPRDGEGLVAGAQIPQDVWAILSGPVDPSTLDAVTLSRDGDPVPGVAHLGDDASEVRFTPAAPLEPGLYTFMVGAGLRALGGGPLGQPRVSTFRVGPDPAARAADLDRDGEVAILDLQVRRDVKGGRTQGTVPDFPPVFVSGTGPVEVGTVAGAQVDLEVVDADGGAVSLSPDGLPEGAHLERTGENRFSLTIPGVAAGQTIQLVATNQNGETTTVSLVTTSRRTNSAPSLLLVRVTDAYDDLKAEPYRVKENSELYFEFEAIDVDLIDPTGADHVTFVPPTSPGLELVEQRGVRGERALFRYHPDFDQAGERRLDFQVRDDEGVTAVSSLALTVVNTNRSPVLTRVLPTEDQTRSSGPVHFEWVAEDPDGSPVEIMLNDYDLEVAAAAGYITLLGRSSGPGYARATVVLNEPGAITLTAVASDGLAVALDSHVLLYPHVPTTESRFVTSTGATGFFRTDYVPLALEQRPDDPETEEEDDPYWVSRGRVLVLNEGPSAGPVTDVRIRGPLSNRVEEITWTGTPGFISVTFKPEVDFSTDPVSENEFEIHAGGRVYLAPVTFVEGHKKEAEPRVLQAPELLAPPVGLETSLAQLHIRVKDAHLARTLVVRGPTTLLIPLPGSPELPVDRQVGDLDLHLYANLPRVPNQALRIWVVYWTGLNTTFASPELVIPVPGTPRVVTQACFARSALDGTGRLRALATDGFQSHGFPILPEGLRAEDQPLDPDNPYALYLVVPDTGLPNASYTASLRMVALGVHQPIPLTGPAGQLLVDGLSTADYRRSLPMFFTFRSQPAGSLTPIRILADRIVVSIGAPQVGDYVPPDGFELADDEFPPAGFFGGGFEAHVTISAFGEPRFAGGFSQLDGLFVPGLSLRRPEVDRGYPYGIETFPSYVLHGGNAWCNDQVEAWDPYMGISSLFVSDPLLAAPAALSPTGPGSTPIIYSVGHYMRSAPGFLPGPNHVRLSRTPTDTGSEPPGRSFEGTFELTISNRAIPAKTGEGLTVDFTCDGARIADPTQQAFRQADVRLDDVEGPGVSRVGACLLATGEVTIDRVDLLIPGIPGRPETDFVLERTYRSQIHYHGPLGRSWCSNWFEILDFDGGEPDRPEPKTSAVKDPERVVRVIGSAYVGVWHRKNAREYVSGSKGEFGTLFHDEDDGTWVLRLPDGSKRQYDRVGLLTKIVNRYGDALEVVIDEATNQIDYVKDVYGRTIDFSHEKVNGHFYLTKVTDFTGRTVEYVREGEVLKAVVLPHDSTAPERREEYTYSSLPPLVTEDPYDDDEVREELNFNLLTITSPGNGGPATQTFRYYETEPRSPNYDKIEQISTAGTNGSGVPSGGVRRFSYDPYEGDPLLPGADLKVTVEEPNGRVHEHFINKEQRLEMGVREYEQLDRSGRSFLTRMFYNEDGLPTFRVNPEGDVEQFVYVSDGPRGSERNLKEHTRYAGRDSDQRWLKTTYTYEPLFNQIASVTDARGYYPVTDGGVVGPVSQQRYTTYYFYDYQESLDEIPELRAFGLTLGSIRRGLNDLNGDGVTPPNRLHGCLVRVESPAVVLEPDSPLIAENGGSPIQTFATRYQWGAHGQLLARIDPMGFVTRYRYYPMSEPTGSGGGAATDAPSAGGYLAEEILDAQRTTPALPAPLELRSRYRYDQRGNRTVEVDPRGVTETTEFNVWNQPTKITRASAAPAILGPPQQLVTTSRHDSLGRIIEVVTGAGLGAGPEAEVRTQLTYDLMGNVVRKRITGSGLARPLETEYSYDPSGNPTSTKTPRQVVTRITYDGRDLQSSITRALGTDDESTVTFRYDGNKNLTHATDAEDTDQNGVADTTVREYDGFNRLRRVTDPLGNSVLSRYDPAGRVVRQTAFGPTGPDSSAIVVLADTAFELDDHGRVHRARQLLLGQGTSQSSQSIHRTEYDANSRPRYSYAPDGQRTEAIFDAVGRRVEVVDAAGNRTVVTYDENGNPTLTVSRERSPRTSLLDEFRTEREFDALNRLVRVTDPAGGESRFTYDTRDNLVSASDPLRNIVRREHDALNRVTREIRELRNGGVGPTPGTTPTGSQRGALHGEIELAYEWDDDSRLVGITDDNGRRTTFVYDALDRRTEIRLANGARYLSNYDLDGNLVRTQDANNNVVLRTYDALNRLRIVTAETLTGGPTVGTSQQTFGYDGLSRLRRAVDVAPAPLAGSVASTCEWTYDTLGRLLTETQDGALVKSQYAPDGSRRELAYPGGKTLTFGYDAIDRVVTVSQGVSTAPDGEVTGLPQLFSTDWAGPGYRLAHRRHLNGTQIETTYDDLLRPTHQACSPLNLPGARFLEREYGYNAASHRTSERRLDEPHQPQDRFTLDSVYRITGSSYDRPGQEPREVSYALDDVGNRLLAGDVGAVLSYSVSVVNEYERVGDTVRAYDDNGNLEDDGTNRYLYDAFDRLTCVLRKSPTSPVGDTLVAYYTYHADGRRSRARTYSGDALVADTRFVYDGDREIEERTSTGATLATFVWGPEYVDSLVQFERTALHPKGAGTYFVHTDARFDVVAVTDHNGIVVEKRHYDDFGAMTFTLGGQAGASSIGLAYGFQGRRHDAETGLIFFRARYYEPSMGRFMSRDPVWDPTSLGNQYTFAGNAPTTLMDPSGEIVPAIIAAAAAYAFWTAVNTAVDTAIEYGTSRAFGGEFNLGQSLAVNGIINAVTGGFGGKIARCAKFARIVGARYAVNYTLRSVADAALTSGAELVVKGETDGWANLIGGFVGHGVGDVLEAGFRRIVKACFLAGTLVETRDGRKAIESLREGDEVLSRDELTGEQGYKPVVQLFRGHTDKVAYVRIAEAARPTSMRP